MHLFIVRFLYDRKSFDDQKNSTLHRGVLMLKKSFIGFSLLTYSLFSFCLTANAATFELSSPTIKPDSQLTDAYVFNGFGCSGKNTSPALQWKNAPAGTK